MLRALAYAAKAAGLTYSLLSTGVLIGFLVAGVLKHTTKEKSC